MYSSTEYQFISITDPEDITLRPYIFIGVQHIHLSAFRAGEFNPVAKEKAKR